MEFAEGIFTENTATVNLVGKEGPGELVAYTLDGFGKVTTAFDTRDGFDESDRYTGVSESHQHLNWAFTEPGIYHLELEASAQLAAGGNELTTADELMVQVGAGLAYLREIDSDQGGWASTESLGAAYDEDFP